MKKEDILTRPAYWFEQEQNELFRQVTAYMERERINRTELASRLNVHRSYVTQILNGNFNFTLKKWIELCLALKLVPNIRYESLSTVLSSEIVTSKVIDLYPQWINENTNAASPTEPAQNYSSFSNRQGIRTNVRMKSAPNKLVNAS